MDRTQGRRGTVEEAIRKTTETWIKHTSGMSAGTPGQMPPTLVPSPVIPRVPKSFAATGRESSDIFAKAANEVIKEIRAERAAEEQVVGCRSKRLRKYDDQICRINWLVELCGAVRCCDINTSFSRQMGSKYRNQHGSKPKPEYGNPSYEFLTG